ncbi:hypothetical protein BN77_2466 [Rhizobium mesoamericanum STM3625]|uniref:Uncharacterized protein n=1 Tax=Rhizobium mesoamericanum STM3625 TaxID=1211777 RepID=K0PFL4_9HYPH|nr:hypothetical protein BN77_2466 [Rhizobium mesoamericanum STM3625]
MSLIRKAAGAASKLSVIAFIPTLRIVLALRSKQGQNTYLHI